MQCCVCVVVLQAYPEKFYYEGIQDLQMPIQHQYLPVYFGNVCLRFIPVSHTGHYLNSSCSDFGIEKISTAEILVKCIDTVLFELSKMVKK